MNKRPFFLLPFLLVFQILTAQTMKEQLVGRVVDIANNTGIEGVEVQLLSLGTIKYTDAEGKFKFENPKGFVVGEPNYSFALQKKGYLSVGSVDNKVVYGSGAIENLSMKKDLERFLWITVLDGKTVEVLEQAKINIKGTVQKTDEFGKAQFDFSAFDKTTLKAVIRKNCYKDEIIEVSTKGEVFVKMIPDCTTDTSKPSRTIDINNAPLIIDRALKAKNGSKQGQVEAIQFLLKSDYSFNGTDFSGVNLENIQFQNTDLTRAIFDFSSLNRANLNGSNLSKTSLDFTTGNGLTLENGIFSGVRATYLNAQKASFKGSDLSGSFFFGCDFSDSDFSNAHLEGTVFAFCTLNRAVFDKSTLLNTAFTGSILNGASFQNTQIENVEVRGASVTEGPIPFSTEQLLGLCKNPSYGRRGVYHFKLIKVEESVNTGNGKYDNIFEKRYGFANFNGTTFNHCSNDFVIGEKIKNDAFDWVSVYQSDTFLKGNGRIAQVRKTVNDHFKEIKSYLLPEYTLKNHEIIEEWEKEVRKHSTQKSFGSTPLFSREVALALLLKKKQINPGEIDWAKYTRSHLGESVKGSNEKIDGLSSQYLFPFAINWFDLPADWDGLYRRWIFNNTSSDIKNFTFPIIGYKPQLQENGSVQLSLPKVGNRNKSINAVLESKNIAVERTLLPQVNMVTEGLQVLFVYKEPTNILLSGASAFTQEEMQGVFELNQIAKITDVELIKGTDSQQYALIYIEPLSFYYQKGNKDWKKATSFKFFNEKP